MTPVLELLSYGRVLGVFALALFALPILVEWEPRRAAGRPGRFFLQAGSAFVRASFLLALLVVVLGKSRLSFPGTIVIFYLLAAAIIACIRRRKTLRVWELIHDSVYRLMVLIERRSWARSRPAHSRIPSIVGSKRISALSAVFALLVVVTFLERSSFALNNARFTRAETYDRALRLGEMMNSGANGTDASVAPLAVVSCLTGLDPASVIRFTGPIFGILLAAAAALCAFRICRRFWMAFVAFGLVAALPLLLSDSNPGEVTREQIAALFALLGITFAFDNIVTALMAVAMTMAIEPRCGAQVLLLLTCIAIAAVLGGLIEALPWPIRAFVTPTLGLAFLAVPLSMMSSETPDGPFQYESAAQACLRIKSGLPRNSWLVISPGQERAFTADYGWHMELLSFVTNYTPDQVENPAFRFGWPVRDVFLFIEKRPLCVPREVHSRALARIVSSSPAPYRQPAGCRIEPAHASLEFDAAEIIASYARGRQNVSIFQEDDNLTVYHIDLSKPDSRT